MKGEAVVAIDPADQMMHDGGVRFVLWHAEQLSRIRCQMNRAGIIELVNLVR